MMGPFKDPVLAGMVSGQVCAHQVPQRNASSFMDFACQRAESPVHFLMVFYFG